MAKQTQTEPTVAQSTEKVDRATMAQFIDFKQIIAS